MAPDKFYYRLCEAEKLKQTYSSWINKRAHIGNGQYEILKNISITPKRQATKPGQQENLFIVKFEFLNAKKIDAWTFLKNNGLVNPVSHSYDSSNAHGLNNSINQ